MLKNNIIIAIRLLLRQRTYSLINLFGLTLGLASFLVIVLFYQYQNSYDQYLSKKDRIVRINRQMSSNQGAGYISKISLNAAESLENKITGVEKSLKISSYQLELSYDDKSFREIYLWAADPSVFDFFDIEMIVGNPEEALTSANCIVLTESMAHKYFGSDNALSKSITTIDKDGRRLDLKVTGVVKDIPANSHLIINGLFSYPTARYLMEEEEINNWYSCHTYLMLENGTDMNDIETIVSNSLRQQVPAEGFERVSFSLMPVTDIFFNASKDGGAQRGSKLLTNILLLIGFFILLIAGLNYINLATARSLKRSREVGIRKVSGANKWQLVNQFLGESILFSTLALTGALFLIYLLLPSINNFSNIMYRIDLGLKDIIQPSFLFIALLSTLITGILSGLYPAFVISGFKPIKSLKGENITRGGISSKKFLVVMQYVVSIFLIVCCLSIYKVFDHLRNQHFGFNKENIIAINIDYIKSPEKVVRLKQDLKEIHGVLDVAGTSKIPLSHRNESTVRIYNEAKDFKESMPLLYIDENYFDLLDIKVLQKSTTEEQGIFVSQKFIDKYGDQYSIGNAVDIYSFDDPKKVLSTSMITGVVNDIKDRVLSPDKGPVIFKYDEKAFNYLLVKLDSKRQHETISALESTFKTQHPFLAFNFAFIDDEMNFMLNTITPFSKLIIFATILAVIVASMGLFALALFITQQRTKEVGIRKIFGSSELSISILLSRQYIKLILYSFLISGPLTFSGFKWIFSFFPEKLEMSWWILFALGAGLIMLAILTVFGQSWKAARSNPVDTLRYE